jgi:uncharacterized protein YbaR (Trm112 family)
MPSESAPAFSFDAKVLEQLACPACLGDLGLVGDLPGEERLVCKACERGYPIVDGIPVLIAERAESKATKQVIY